MMFKMKNKNNIFLMPFDGGNLKKKGSSKAPEYLKELFVTYSSNSFFNVVVDNYNLEFTQNNIIKNVSEFSDKDNFVIGLGGDHSITYGMIEGLKKIHSSFKIIYFDAHLDCEDDFFPPSHEDVVKSLINNKIISANDILIIGVRNIWKEEIDFCVENNVRYLDNTVNIEDIKKEIGDFIGDSLFYVSVDIDFFDEKISYATGHPESNGYNFDQFLEIMQSLDNQKFTKNNIGFDLVEIIPELDVKEDSKKLAKKIINIFMKKS